MLWSPRTLRGQAVHPPVSQYHHSQVDGNHILFTPPWTRRDSQRLLMVSPSHNPWLWGSSSQDLASIHPAAVSDLVSPILFSVTRENPLLGDHSCSLGTPRQHSFLISSFFPKGVTPTPPTAVPSIVLPCRILSLQGRNVSPTLPDN